MATMDHGGWYYLDGETSLGPVSWQRLIELRSATIIKSDTLVWQEGTDRWQSFGEASAERLPRPPPLPFTSEAAATSPPDLRQSFPRSTGSDAPAAISQWREIQADTKRWPLGPVVPFRRFFARMLDILVNGVIGFVLLGFALYAFVPISAAGMFSSLDGVAGGLVDSFLTVLISVPITGVIVGLTGSSLGKILFGLKVLDQNRRPLGIPRALQREFRVWFAGMGMGLPVVYLVCVIVAFNNLKKRGDTSWDQAVGAVIYHRPKGPLQYTLFTIGVLLLLAAIGILRAQ